MKAEIVAGLVNAGIPFVVGIYMAREGQRRLSLSTGAHLPGSGAHTTQSRVLKWGGVFLVVFASIMAGRNYYKIHSNAASPSPEWQRFQSMDGLTTVEFPAKPDLERGGESGHQRRSLSRWDSSVFFLLSNVNIPEDEGRTAEQYLDRVREEILASPELKAKLVFEKFEGVVNGVGRRMEFLVAGQQKMRVRCIVVGLSLNRALVVEPVENPHSSETDRFLESFELATGKQSK